MGRLVRAAGILANQGGAAGRAVKNAVVALAAPTDQLESVTINDDGSDTSTWPNRLEMWFNSGGKTRRTTYFNEYGELRVAPGKTNTVAVRFFAKEMATDAAHSSSVAVFEVMDDRQTRTQLFAVMPDGKVIAPNIGAKTITYPTGSEPTLSGLTNGTLLVEYTP